MKKVELRQNYYIYNVLWEIDFEEQSSINFLHCQQRHYSTLHTQNSWIKQSGECYSLRYIPKITICTHS